MRKDRVEIDLSKGKEWKNYSLELDLTRQIAKDTAEELRRIENFNTKVWPEDFDGRAFNLDLTREELYGKMHNDQDFLPKYILATESCISWEDAEKLFELHLAHKQKLLDRVHSYQNSRKPLALYPQEPKPKKIFENPHKRRGSKGWRRRAADAMQMQIQREKYTDEERSNAVNNADLDRHFY